MLCFQQMLIKVWYTNHRIWKVATALWALLIAIVCFIPGKNLPQLKWDLFSVDTLAHFGLYFILAVFMSLAQQKIKLNLFEPGLYLIVLAVFLYGLMIELTQGFYIDGRFFDYWDLAANGTGTIFGVILVKLIGIK